MKLGRGTNASAVPDSRAIAICGRGMAEEKELTHHRRTATMSGIGPEPKCRDVRDLVAIGWKADLTRTSNFGRD